MDRIDGAGTTDIGGGRRGFRDENLGSGIEGTEVTALWANMLQEELMAVIEQAGLVASGADWTQLLQAIRSQKWSYLAAAGTANAIVVTPAPAYSTLATLVGVPLRIMPSADNVGAVTLQVNGLAATSVTWKNRTLWDGAIKAGVPITVIYTGAHFEILDPAPLAPGKQIYSAAGSYTFVVPAGVYVIDYAVIGAGGASGYSTSGSNHGEGGGGGGGAYGRMAVTPGQSIAVVVGAAGTRSGTVGGAGGTSSFGGISATGGGATSTGSPGSGGVGSGGDINFAGEGGLNGDSTANQYAGIGGDAGGPMGGRGAQSQVGGTWPGGGGWSVWNTTPTYSEGPAAVGGVILRWGEK